MSGSRDDDGYQRPQAATIAKVVLPATLEPVVDAETARIFAMLEKHGYKKLEIIGGGVTGAVALFAYTGNDAAIKNLAVNGVVLLKLPSTQKSTALEVKHATMTYENEWNNIVAINQAKKQKRNNKKINFHLPEVMAIEIEGMKVIINQVINYTEKPKNAQVLLGELGKKDALWKVAQDKPIHENKTAKFATKQFDKMFSRYYESLTTLHQLHFLHLDLAPRNLAMGDRGNNAFLIDFGASLPCDRMGNTLNYINFPLTPAYTYNQATLLQIMEFKRANKNAFASSPLRGVYSIHTDLFAFRVSLIESLASYCGVHNMKKYLHVKGLSGKFVELDDLVRVDDVTRLENSLKNLGDLARALEVKKDMRGTLVLTVINKYRDYLTQMPQGDNLEVVMRADRKLFRNCMLTNTAGILRMLVAGKSVPEAKKEEVRLDKENVPNYVEYDPADAYELDRNEKAVGIKSKK